MNTLIKKSFGKIHSHHVITWLLLQNFINGNEYQSAGHFGDKEVYMCALGWQFVSYKGSTRISDKIYNEFSAKVIERKTFKTKSGHDHYKYKLLDTFSPTDFPQEYQGLIQIFKTSNEYLKYKNERR